MVSFPSEKMTDTLSVETLVGSRTKVQSSTTNDPTEAGLALKMESLHQRKIPSSKLVPIGLEVEQDILVLPLKTFPFGGTTMDSRAPSLEVTFWAKVILKASKIAGFTPILRLEK